MTFEESLQDVTIRERQLHAHIIRSAEYLKKADRELKRQVSTLYLAIALLILFQGLFALREAVQIPLSCTALIAVTSLLAIVNCLLMIQTKNSLRELNEAWLKPEEKVALDSLRTQRNELLTRVPRSREASNENAELN
jgi:Na+/H+ antiporter NhaD/arsenite permease-like protein